ncbi:MAG TPA: PAS domain-containing protein, partial [Nitrospirota bacterium]|nr:PAS domain-containing protein [Nitrospirota bacterium]
ANDEAARLTGHTKYDLLHKNLFELFVDPVQPGEILEEIKDGRQSLKQGKLKKTDGTAVPVEVSAVGLTLLGKHFVQSVIRDISLQTSLINIIEEKERELSILKTTLKSSK